MTGGLEPDVLRAELAPDDARRLLDEVARIATIRAVREAGASESATLAPEEFAAASARLLGGATRRLQVQYRHDGIDWIDTYLAGGPGFRLVRVAAPRSDGPPAA